MTMRRSPEGKWRVYGRYMDGTEGYMDGTEGYMDGIWTVLKGKYGESVPMQRSHEGISVTSVASVLSGISVI